MLARSALALTAALAGMTALAVPSPVLADAKYGTVCDGTDRDELPDFRARFSPAVVAPGQPTLYTLRIRDDWNRAEVSLFLGSMEESGYKSFYGTMIHHAETQVVQKIFYPTEDMTITWTGAIYCEPDSHYDMAEDLSPATVRVIAP